MNKIKQLTLVITAVSACATALPATAQKAGDILLRFGPASVMPNDDSGKIDGLPGNNRVEVDDGTSLAFTVSYMYTDNIGFSVLGALPFEHDIKGDKDLDGVDVATIDQLPPTFTVDYYFQPDADVRPYIGAGINYTIFSDEDADSELEDAVGDTDIDLDDSVGLAVMAGVDVDINENWFFNASLWYIDIDTEADLDTELAGDLEVDVDIDPWVVMVGVGTTFE